MSISGWPVDKENYGVYCMFSLASLSAYQSFLQRNHVWESVFNKVVMYLKALEKCGCTTVQVADVKLDP